MEVGDPAPEIRLPDLSGREWTLTELLRDGAVHLVFLRHLSHVKRVWEYRDEYVRQQVRPVLISFVEGVRITSYLQKLGMHDKDFLILLDGDRKSYSDYGMRKSFLASYSIPNLLFYAQRLSHFERPEEDTTQLGGDFLVAENGNLLLAHLPKNPTDRIPVTKVLRAKNPNIENLVDYEDEVADACALPRD